MPMEPNKPGMREIVHKGSKIRTPFIYAQTNKSMGGKKMYKAPKKDRSHNSGRY